MLPVFATCDYVVECFELVCCYANQSCSLRQEDLQGRVLVRTLTRTSARGEYPSDLVTQFEILVTLIVIQLYKMLGLVALPVL